MRRVTQRYATIFIATGERTRIYHSVDEVPAELRQKLLVSTRGVNSATILIADKGGREEILRALHSPEADADSLTVPPRNEHRNLPSPRYLKFRPRFSTPARLLLAGCLGYLFWILISLRS